MFKQAFEIKHCQHCNKAFEDINASVFANHVKWCDKNPKKKEFLKNLKSANGKKIDRLHKME